MNKLKQHKGIVKRFKISNPKKGSGKLKKQSIGTGCKHLKTKQSNPRKRRIRKPRNITAVTSLKKSLKLS